MNLIADLQQRLERIFRQAFRVGDITESLISFDAELPAPRALQALDRRRFSLAGVRERGMLTGYVRTEDLRGEQGNVGERMRPLDEDEIVSADAPMADALRRLADRDWLLVSAFGGVGGIVTWSDLQKPAVRMWLFGLVTVIEESFASLVDLWYPEEAWLPLLSAGRRAKARALLQERQRLDTGSTLGLLDCLQLSDKGQLLLRSPETRRLLGFPSKEAGEKTLRRLSRLRDNLAHAQDIVSDDWEMILQLAERVEGIMRLGSVFPGRRRSRPRRARKG